MRWASISWDKENGITVQLDFLCLYCIVWLNYKPLNYTLSESHPTSRYNINLYRDARLSLVHDELNPVCRTYDGDIYDIRHPCGDIFAGVSNAENTSNRVVTRATIASNAIRSIEFRAEKETQLHGSTVSKRVCYSTSVTSISFWHLSL